MHDYRSLGGVLSFLKVLLKLSGSSGNKLLYRSLIRSNWYLIKVKQCCINTVSVLMSMNFLSETSPRLRLWAPDHLQALLKAWLSFCYRFDYRLVDVEDFIFETSLQLSGQLLSAPIIVFFGGALSFLNKSLMLRMLCDPSLLNWLTLVLTVSHMLQHRSSPSPPLGMVMFCPPPPPVDLWCVYIGVNAS